MRFPSLIVSLSFAVTLAVACGGKTAPPPATSKRAADAPVSNNEWKELCEAQAERARRCPGPAPGPLATCTEDAMCFGALVRADVVRALARCQTQNDCTRPCSIDRVTASLPPTPSMTALAEACATRRVVCPSLDCNALVRPVQPLEAASLTPLVECLKYEKTCLDAAACVLEKMSPVVAKLTACNPTLPTPATPDEKPAAGPPAPP